jgi:hypothetical protein
MTISAFASNVEAMNLGSLSRQSPIPVVTEFASVADPAVCRDLTCGLEGREINDIVPVIHIIFASVSGFVAKARLQLAATTSVG